MCRAWRWWKGDDVKQRIIDLRSDKMPNWFPVVVLFSYFSRNSSLNIDFDNLFKAVCLKFPEPVDLELVLLGHSGTLGVIMELILRHSESSDDFDDWQLTKLGAINVHQEVETRAWHHQPLIATKAFSPEELLCTAAKIYGCIRDLATQDGAFITAEGGEKERKSNN